MWIYRDAFYGARRPAYNIDTVPRSATACDDEFNDGAFAPKWSWVAHGGGAGSPAVYNETTYPGQLYVANGNTVQSYFMKQTTTIGVDAFELIVKVTSMKPGDGAHDPGLALFAADAAGQNGAAVLFRQVVKGTKGQVQFGHVGVGGWGANIYYDVISNLSVSQASYAGFPIWLKLKRDAAGNGLYYVSQDGLTWDLQLAGAAFATSVARIGLVFNFGTCYIDSATDNPSTCTIDYFRKTA